MLFQVARQDLDQIILPHVPTQPPHNKARARNNWRNVKNKLFGQQGIFHNFRKGDCRIQPLYFIEKVSRKHLYPKFPGWFGFNYLTQLFQQSKTLTRSFDTWAAQKYNHLSVEYLDEAARAQYRVTVQNKTLVYTNGSPVPTGDVMFVFGKDGHLYVAKKRHGHFHHSSFFSGGPVQAAGMFHIGPGGKVLSMNNNSGHYIPTAEQMELVRQKLQSEGMSIGPDA